MQPASGLLIFLSTYPQIMLLASLQVRAVKLQGAASGQVDDHVAKEKKDVCFRAQKELILPCVGFPSSLINKIIKEKEWAWKCYSYTCPFQAVKVFLFFRKQEDWG